MGNESSSERSARGISDQHKKQHYRNKVEAYMGRAEVLKKHMEDEQKRMNHHEQIVIEHNSIGHSYESVFGKFLISDVKSILLEDPYIRTFHQCQNLLRFSELAVKKCASLREMTVVTSEDPSSSEQQRLWLDQLREELRVKHSITLAVHFSSTLHDRQIRLSNGWIIRLGRGLDYFKPPEGKFCLGNYDLDWRPCHATTIDIFHQDNVRTNAS
ncbi:MIT domain-containing protein 1-like isoform X2 [Macrosteles quadrilineatus]|uniref:MIT domain-containing protein 1-like isoform X2 n=1 Tax=Macrosteles quadrilineatus TaxID=74068 RepID=UPI0023E2E248|nr:MIT domain-containing protein 1-like isoform X2 [Macrosteles quadrilineatus]XP_054291052.1 MIT domain-containing protein 1-like isoform X2 [Macrosteles quadrilineatus]